MEVREREREKERERFVDGIAFMVRQLMGLLSTFIIGYLCFYFIWQKVVKLLYEI